MLLPKDDKDKTEQTPVSLSKAEPATAGVTAAPSEQAVAAAAKKKRRKRSKK